MLRLTGAFLIAVFLFTVNCVFGPSSAESISTLTRLTNTPEQSLNLNPTLSDDGRVVVFESSADLTGDEPGTSFRAYRGDLRAATPVFTSMANTRAVSPAVSGDGRNIVFVSTEDPLGQNADRNSEIFLFAGSGLRQLTVTEPSADSTRLADGSFQPSITSDGKTVAFSSNRDFAGGNSGQGYQIFLYDVEKQTFTQLTHDSADRAAHSPKISGDGSRVFYRRTPVDTAESGDLVLIEIKALASRVVAANVADLSLSEGRAVSNDGMRLVYAAQTAPNQSQVFIYESRDDAVRQVTQLGSRSADVKLQPTISGDGKRVAFATRRRVVNPSDGSVELYLLDLPTGEVQQITNAPSGGTAEVVASLNLDGTLVAFNFPRLLSGPVGDEDLRNNSEIYLASIAARSEFGQATVVNAASQGREPAEETLIAPGSIASIRGSALAFKTEAATFAGADPPFAVAGTTVKVNGQSARIFYAAPDEVVILVPGNLANGPAEFLVTNADGFVSKAQANIVTAAPGVFAVAGDGRGAAVTLNASTLTPGPFDPSSGQLRLSLFGTGISQASKVSVTIRGSAALVETVAAGNLAGIDEIHVLVPAELSGAGTSTVVVTADGVRSNSTSVVLEGVVPTPSPSPSPSATPTSTPTPTPTPTPMPSPTPTPTPIPTPTATPTPIPTPTPSPTPTATPIPSVSPTPSTTPTPSPTPTPTATPTPTPSPTPSPSPSPTPTPTATPTPSPSPTPTPSPSPVGSTGVVISQIYGGGGNSGAPFRNDFIEVFNNGNTPVDLTGWSVQYASATASSWSVTPLASLVLQPGQYYLIQEGSGGSNGLLLPTPDATGTIAMAAGSGKVALVRNSTALTGACPNDANIVDLVGYGNTASCFKGSPAPAGSNTNAIRRAVNGCVNTNSNAADFATGAPNPRNTTSPKSVCEIASTQDWISPRKVARTQGPDLRLPEAFLCTFAPLRGNFFRGG